MSEALEQLSFGLSYSPTTKGLYTSSDACEPGNESSKQLENSQCDLAGGEQYVGCEESAGQSPSQPAAEGSNETTPRYVPGHRKAFSLPRTLEVVNDQGNISSVPLSTELESPRSTLLRYGVVQQPLVFDRESAISSISSLSTRTDFSQNEQNSDTSSRGDSGIQSQISEVCQVPGGGSAGSPIAGCSATGAVPAQKHHGKRVSLDFLTKGLTANWRLLSRSGHNVATRFMRSSGGQSSPSAGHEAGSNEDQSKFWKFGVGESLAASRGSSVASSQSLIMEDRPPGLPTKNAEEKERHNQEFMSILDSLKRREKVESAERKRKAEVQRKAEDDLAAAASIWSSQIIPNWATAHTSKKTLSLWWKGLPPPVRGKVWKLALPNQLSLTPQLYSILVTRAQDLIQSWEKGENLQFKSPTHSVRSTDSGREQDKGAPSVQCREETLELIKLDVARTFPQLCIFQKGGPYYNLLHNVLGAYVCYRPDLGYVQGMSFIAAILILNLDESDAFILFANLVHRPLLSAFFTLDQPLMEGYYCSFSNLLSTHLPQISTHFNNLGFKPDLYLLDWVMTLFGKAAPLELTCRIWDIMFRDGQEFLFKAALGILSLYQERILAENDFVEVAQFLSKLPESTHPDLLFKEIEALNLCSKHKSFPHVFSH